VWQLRCSVRTHMKLMVAFHNCISGAPKMDLEKCVVLLENGYTHLIPLFDAP